MRVTTGSKTEHCARLSASWRAGNSVAITPRSSDAFETSHRLVPDGALCSDPGDRPGGSLYLDEREVGSDRRSLLVGDRDAHLRRILDGPDASSPDRRLGVLLCLEAWDA